MPEREKADIEPIKRSIDILRPIRFGDIKTSAEILGLVSSSVDGDETDVLERLRPAQEKADAIGPIEPEFEEGREGPKRRFFENGPRLSAIESVKSARSANVLAL